MKMVRFTYTIKSLEDGRVLDDGFGDVAEGQDEDGVDAHDLIYDVARETASDATHEYGKPVYVLVSIREMACRLWMSADGFVLYSHIE